MNDNILLVDDDPGVIQLLGRILVDAGNLQFTTNGKDALRMARICPPDLILLDAEMPGMSGFQFLDSLKADPHLAETPVIFVTSHSETGFEVSALEMGAVDFISKPFRSALVLARVNTHLRLRRMAETLRRNTSTDLVTGVASRSQFDDLLEKEWLRGLRGGKPMALLLLDVDEFKSYGEQFGHIKADACLRQVASALLSSASRPADFVARCGGEEFAMLLPETDRHGGEHVARRVLGAVAQLGIRRDADVKSGHVSVSIGVASFDEYSESWANRSADEHPGLNLQLRGMGADLVFAAARALSLAKRAGRGQVRLLDICDVGNTVRAGGAALSR